MPPAAGSPGEPNMCGVVALAADARGADARVRAKEFGHLQTRPDAEAMLSMLVALFAEVGGGGAQLKQDGAVVGSSGSGGSSSSRFAWVRPEDVPASPSRSSLSFRESLVHEDHLTKVLQDQLTGLDVAVDRSFLHDGAGGDGGHLYSRRIFLTAPEGAPHDLGGHRVAHAILHTNLDRLPAAVRDGVRSEKIPFGRLLMEHVRERCVLLRACWRIHLGPGLVADFAVPAHPPPRGATPETPASRACNANAGAGEEDEENVTYGRTVTIVCDGQVAAEVLEIMAPKKRREADGGRGDA